ncbi:magnesium transporter [Anaerofustis stercorihominis DSM 17244]|uniref:Magnesium transporter MgtE n=1 Tax=Anaerofustis stercorihominis DSM 17244 TaxID=445971 RepID=B1C628_9FIRM|nr:magnesium transporter [Anaerofustis stercorihominis]EDS73597.1 magnesium transporter [Anaerofustis stercorihominis DSM 17244]
MEEKILRLLNERRFYELKKFLETLNPNDIAPLFDEIPMEDVLIIFRLLPKETAAETFVEIDNDNQEYLIRAFSDEELKEVLDLLFVDDTADLVEEMPANVAKRVLKHTDVKTRKLINEILKYPEDSAGSIMTTEFVSLRKDMTVLEALNKIKATGVDKETIYTCYVTDKTKKLIGLVSTKDILLSDMDEMIEDIMETNFIYTHTLADREDVVKMFDKYDLLAVPVVDKEDRLIGIITVDDAIDVIREENTEDFEKMAAMMPSDESYFKTPAFTHAKNRIMWLLFLMLSATMTQAVITHYEAAFATVPLLVAFIPMITGTGGNCGSQSSTMIIRGLALDEIEPKDVFKAMLKEGEIGLLVGVSLAIVNGIRIIIFYHDTILALVLGITLIATIIMAKLMGCILPIAAKKLKLDPAIMAAPLITTLVDTCSILVYFNVALKIMNL